jgi:FlaA1/EpsC-like NDP-sugar epimerase
VLGIVSGYGRIPVFVLLLLQNLALSFVMLVAFRFTIFYLYRLLSSYNAGRYKKRGVILGIENQSVALANSLAVKEYQGYKIVGFLTKDKNLVKQRILNLPVYSYEKGLSRVITENRIKALILTEKDQITAEIKEVVRECTSLDVAVLSPQPLRAWNGQPLTKMSANAQLK